MTDESVGYNPADDGPGVVVKGVKRLNKLPMVIFISVLAIVIILLMWAVMDRTSTQQRAEAEVEHDSIESAVNPTEELFANQPRGIIQPIQAGLSDATAGRRGFTDPSRPQIPADGIQPYGDEMDPEYEERLRQIRDRAALDAAEYEHSLALREKRNREQILIAASGSTTGLELPGLSTVLSPEDAVALAGASNAELGASPFAPGALSANLGQDVTGATQLIASGLGGQFRGSQTRAQAAFAESLASQTGDLSAVLGAGLPSQGSAFRPDPNGQEGKTKFLEEASTNVNYLDNRLEDPRSPYELKQSTVIPGIMITGINSDLPGRMIAQVSQDVYDTASGQHLLIPQGARLFGVYDSSVSFGQSRVLVAWTRIILPNGQAIDIGGMPGTDRIGIGGFGDKVNRHLVRLYGNAVLLSLVSGGLDAARNPSGSGDDDQLADAITQSFGDVFSRVATETFERELDVQPTLKVRPGFRFNIIVDQDIILQPYQD